MDIFKIKRDIQERQLFVAIIEEFVLTMRCIEYLTKFCIRDQKCGTNLLPSRPGARKIEESQNIY